MTVLAPAPGKLRGRLRVPGDKSISHRALLLAARAKGRSRITGLSAGGDVRATQRAVAAFGAGVAVEGGAVVVDGGVGRLHEPAAPVDLGNSGTGIRLLAGWATVVPGLTVLVGDDSVSSRPMERVTVPLRAMGADIDGRDGGRLAPLVLRGRPLHGIDYDLPVPSAQVKGAVLLAGLAADGTTTVREAVPSRRHTEEMLAAAGADVTVEGGSVRLRPGPLQPTETAVPGDPSQAAFWVVAAALVPGSELLVEQVYVGPGRAAFLDVLQRMGADINLVDHDEVSNVADILVRGGALRATTVSGGEVVGLIDEIPVLAVAAALADGTTTFADAAELRVKETDRIDTMTTELRAIGATVEPLADGLVVTGTGGRPLRGGTTRSHGDHRVAMALAVAALASSDGVSVEGWEAVATSYPGFLEDLHRCVS